jgi:predicted transcriptional regulator
VAEDRALLLSVKPQYADLILDGRKTVELRRTCPSLPAGASVVLYGSSPMRAILGTATLDAVECETPAQLWKSVGHLTGIGFEQFAAYFADTSVAYGLRLIAPRPCEPLPLQELRQHGLEPAQSWRYLTQEQFQHLDLKPFGFTSSAHAETGDSVVEQRRRSTSGRSRTGWFSPSHAHGVVARLVTGLRGVL